MVGCLCGSLSTSSCLLPASCLLEVATSAGASSLFLSSLRSIPSILAVPRASVPLLTPLAGRRLCLWFSTRGSFLLCWFAESQLATTGHTPTPQTLHALVVAPHVNIRTEPMLFRRHVSLSLVCQQNKHDNTPKSPRPPPLTAAAPSTDSNGSGSSSQRQGATPPPTAHARRRARRIIEFFASLSLLSQKGCVAATKYYFICH